MTDKGFNLFDECTARCVDLFYQEEDAPIFGEGPVKCTHLAAQQIHKG